jgi:hypothetical protein
MIPFVQDHLLKQRYFIIDENYSEIYTQIFDENKSELFKIDIDTPTTQVEFKLQN